MLENFTTEQLQQQLDCANAGLNITLAATQFDLEQELCKRKQRPIIQDEQEDIDKAKAWNNFHTEQGFIPEKSY